MIPTTLVAGAGALQRERAIAELLDPATPSAVILEGIPSGETVLPDIPAITVTRIAAGCPCCAGNLVLRVTLNRILRSRPAHLYIGVATITHVEALREFLSTPPYDAYLDLAKDLWLESRTQ